MKPPIWLSLAVTSVDALKLIFFGKCVYSNRWLDKIALLYHTNELKIQFYCSPSQAANLLQYITIPWFLEMNQWLNKPLYYGLPCNTILLIFYSISLPQAEATGIASGVNTPWLFPIRIAPALLMTESQDSPASQTPVWTGVWLRPWFLRDCSRWTTHR